MSAIATCCLHAHALILKAWSIFPHVLCLILWQPTTQCMPNKKSLRTWWNEDKPLAASVSGGLNTAFWMVQNKGKYLEPNFHLVNWLGRTARALVGLWWHFTSPTNYLHVHLTRVQSMHANFHPHASFFLLLFFDGKALSEDKQIKPLGVGAN